MDYSAELQFLKGRYKVYSYNLENFFTRGFDLKSFLTEFAEDMLQVLRDEACEFKIVSNEAINVHKYMNSVLQEINAYRSLNENIS